LEKAATGLIKTVIRVILYGLVGLTAASKLGIDITGIVALASVLTLAVSLSVQDALTNLISGFTLLYTKPFVAGDYVEIAGQGGTVQEIGLTYTKLSTPDNKMISLPNSSVTSAQIVNYTVTGTRRVDITVSASYDSPVQLVLDTLKEAATVPTILDSQPVFVALNSYGDSAINYVVRVWSTTENYWDTYFTITENIKKHFDAKGIAMTYPHLNVHVSQ
jgi:small conductance mechanosensitive channel